MPRLKCTFRQFIDIIEANGFTLRRHEGTSHRIYGGMVAGRLRLVVVAAHNLNDDVKPGTLASMIRQSGLPKGLFCR